MPSALTVGGAEHSPPSVGGEIKNGVLRLAVQRLGQAQPWKLEVCRERDRRTHRRKKASRSAYLRKLRRVLERHCPGFSVPQLSTAMDLERSFGPIYARGLLRQGRFAFAVLGVNSQEMQASIDAAVTFGILWLHACRQSHDGRMLLEGLKLFVPTGSSRSPESVSLTYAKALPNGTYSRWKSARRHSAKSTALIAAT